MYKHRARFARLQKTEGELERAKILRAIDQDDIARLHKLGKQTARIAKATFDIPTGTQSFRRDRDVGRMLVAFQTNDQSFGKESGKDECALGPAPAGLDDPGGMKARSRNIEEEKLAPPNALVLVRETGSCFNVVRQKKLRLARQFIPSFRGDVHSRT